ncbi:MAG: methionyl-tRNA formyltransferase [Acidimicrobiales bacterium]|nr:methionyl-tRNA formyltransferase [Acidimicrobiales bacterium]
MYLGNPAVAVPPLDALHGAGHEVVLVLTSPDRRRGRRSAPTPTPVAARAAELGIPVSHDLEAVADCGADLGVVVAFGQIVPVELLARVPMINLHFSLLPRWRGAAPIERALLAGDPTTGVCLMDLAEGLDVGDVHARVETPIGPTDTAADLRDRLTELGATLLVDALAGGLGSPEAQAGEATYAHKVKREDLHLDWGRPAAELARVVRVGGAWTTYRGDDLKVWEAEVVDDLSTAAPGVLVGDQVATGAGDLRLVEVQPASRSRMATSAWLTGARPAAGERLGG